MLISSPDSSSLRLKIRHLNSGSLANKLLNQQNLISNTVKRSSCCPVWIHPNELIHLHAMRLIYRTSICPLNEWFYDSGIVPWFFLWQKFCYFLTYTVWKHLSVSCKWVKKILAVPLINSLYQELLFNKIVSSGIFLVLIYYTTRIFWRDVEWSYYERVRYITYLVQWYSISACMVIQYQPKENICICVLIHTAPNLSL